MRIESKDLTGTYDLVIVAEYAGLTDPNNPLPHATRQGLEVLKKVLQGHTVCVISKIAWGNSEKPGPGAAVLQQAKMDLLTKDLGFPLTLPVINVISNNTIQEVRKIHEKVPEARRILLICDSYHRLRYEKLIQYFWYYEAWVETLTFEAEWNENHPSPYQKSAASWRKMNIGHYGIMWLMSMRPFIKKYESRTHVD